MALRSLLSTDFYFTTDRSFIRFVYCSFVVLLSFACSFLHSFILSFVPSFVLTLVRFLVHARVEIERVPIQRVNVSGRRLYIIGARDRVRNKEKNYRVIHVVAWGYWSKISRDIRTVFLRPTAI